ncbi:hypothetical protein KBX29_09620 [Corynebacterium sp. CCUG 18816]|uniref:hypothetical protein n=1 Tax=Corynebacterium pseudogenitalium TaxID=38303 RepID=UPI00210C1DCC|nr:hypothetical protein [Corynebacterium pseudogenitalium]MCQ4617080.1 hypothetical protein [Corynebacterium pseudogenitalium]
MLITKVAQPERAATFWTPIALLIGGVFGTVALPALAGCECLIVQGFPETQKPW